MNAKNTITLASVAVLLVSCGGSSDLGSGYPVPTSYIALPSGPGINGGATLRTLRAGDSWEYEVSGTIMREVYDDSSDLQSRLTGPVAGRMVRTVTNSTLNGNPVLKMTDALTYTVNNGLNFVEVYEQYLRQEPDGSVTILGRREQSTDSQGTGIAWLPGTWGAGVARGGRERQTQTPTYPNSFFDISSSLSVTGSETVNSTSTPYTAWRSVYIDTFQKEWNLAARINAGEYPPIGFIMVSNEAVTATEWWLPSAGAPVVREWQSNRADDVVETWAIDATTGSITIQHHLEERKLNLKMVMKNRTLQ